MWQAPAEKIVEKSDGGPSPKNSKIRGRALHVYFFSRVSPLRRTAARLSGASPRTIFGTELYKFKRKLYFIGIIQLTR